MERTDLNELHCITPLRNLRSILEVGILSHVRAAGRPSVSIANPEVQQLRAAKRVPGGRMLHEYANLYISARNAMLYQVLGFPARPPTQHLSVCVLGVDTAVLDLPDVVITDRNAASILSIFLPSPQGLRNLNRDSVFARYWSDEDPIEAMRKKECMMAEVLVPDRVPPRYIRQAYACCSAAINEVNRNLCGIEASVKRDLFFNSGDRYHD